MKKYNFSAGPSILPQQTMEETAKAILDFNGSSFFICTFKSCSHKQSRETNVEFGAVAIKQIPDLSQKLVLGPGLE